jgi:ribokinase
MDILTVEETVMGHIVVVGSINMDLVVKTPRHPMVGETILGSEFRTYPGGKGANQAVAAAKLGCPVKMVGRVGNDSFGDELLEAISIEGLDSEHVIQDRNEPTGVAFITVDQKGQNSIVVAPGANGRVSPQDVQAAEKAFFGASVLLIQLECPLPAVVRAIDLAKEYRLQVVLNPAPGQVLGTDILGKVDYLLPNQSELALISGEQDQNLAIDTLRELGFGALVVTMGSEGVLVVDGKHEIQLPALDVKVVDTTAAGDAFAGGFAVALTEGCELHDAARWGTIAGALAVTRAGAQPSLPTRFEFNRLLKEFERDM